MKTTGEAARSVGEREKDLWGAITDYKDGSCGYRRVQHYLDLYASALEVAATLDLRAGRLACCDGASQESASGTSDAHTDTAAPEGVLSEEYAENLIGFVRTFETGEAAANALPIFLRSAMRPAAPVAVEGVETVEAPLNWRQVSEFCPSCGVESGQSHARGDCDYDGPWFDVSPVEPETSEPEGGESHG